MVANFFENITRLYSLPDLTLYHQVQVDRCSRPGAAIDGRVYVPAGSYIALLEITDYGIMTAIRNITSVGGQDLDRSCVAVGPQAGQLCVSTQEPARLWVVNSTDGWLVQTLDVPEQCIALYAVAALDSGQVMISYLATWYKEFRLAVYSSTSESPTLLTNLTSVTDYVQGLVGVGNLFLAPHAYSSDLLVLSSDGSVLHRVDAVSGVFLHNIRDVTIWQDCVWLGTLFGDLLLLCAD